MAASNRPTVAPYQDLPPVAIRIIYRPGGTPTQIDHPGIEARPVYSQDELAEALQSGWFLHPDEARASVPEPEPEPKRRGRRQDVDA